MARWSVAIRAAMGSVGLPGLDLGGGGVEGGGAGVGFEEEAELRRGVVTAVFGSGGVGRKRGGKRRTTMIVESR